MTARLVALLPLSGPRFGRVSSPRQKSSLSGINSRWCNERHQNARARPVDWTPRPRLPGRPSVAVDMRTWIRRMARGPIRSGARRASTASCGSSASRSHGPRWPRIFSISISPKGRRINVHAGESRVRPPPAPTTVGRRSVIFEAADAVVRTKTLARVRVPGGIRAFVGCWVGPSRRLARCGPIPGLFDALPPKDANNLTTPSFLAD